MLFGWSKSAYRCLAWLGVHTSVGHHCLKKLLIFPFSAEFVDVVVFVLAGDADRVLRLHSTFLLLPLSSACLSRVYCTLRRKFGSIVIVKLLFLQSTSSSCFILRYIFKSYDRKPSQLADLGDAPYAPRIWALEDSRARRCLSRIRKFLFSMQLCPRDLRHITSVITDVDRGRRPPDPTK